jgi:hypothetical protein
VFDPNQRPPDYRAVRGESSFVIFILAIAGLGIGIMLGQRSLRASCGGDATIRACPICPRKGNQ